MSGQEEIWTEAERTLGRGKPFALATVIGVRGSTPREVGAKMIVRDDGQFGTIGGGCGEAEVFRKARLMLDEGGTGRLAEVDLTGDFDQEQVGVCGGIMDVLIDLWSPKSDLPVAHRLAEASRGNRPTALLTRIDQSLGGESRIAAHAVLDADEPIAPPGFGELSGQALARVVALTANAEPALLRVDSDGRLTPVTRVDETAAPCVFLDPVSGAQRLIIIGAGHIAQPLAEMGSMLGFHVTVIDDRAAFANRERFPTADEVIARPFAAALESLKLDRHCYLVAVTRGHSYDQEAVRIALKRANGAFIGMIGSRRRARATLERLGEEGIPAELLDGVHAPLGLDIGAETPSEIALSIMAEILRERRTGARDQANLGVKLGRLKRSP